MGWFKKRKKGSLVQNCGSANLRYLLMNAFHKFIIRKIQAFLGHADELSAAKRGRRFLLTDLRCVITVSIGVSDFPFTKSRTMRIELRVLCNVLFVS